MEKLQELKEQIIAEMATRANVRLTHTEARSVLEFIELMPTMKGVLGYAMRNGLHLKTEEYEKIEQLLNR